MNKTIKIILFVLGIGLFGYGIYTLIAPEASISKGLLDAQKQDNIYSYIDIELGLALLLIGFIGNKILKV